MHIFRVMLGILVGEVVAAAIVAQGGAGLFPIAIALGLLAWGFTAHPKDTVEFLNTNARDLVVGAVSATARLLRSFSRRTAKAPRRR